MTALVLTAFYGFTLSGHFSLGKLLAVAGVGLWRSSISYRRDDSVLLAYLAVCCLTALNSVDAWVSIWGLFGTYSTGLLCALVLVPYWTAFSANERPGLVNGLRASAILMAVVGALQLLGYLLPDELPTGNRVYSTIGSPVYVGAMAALCWPFCRRFERAALVFLLWACGSRGAWVAVAVGQLYASWPLFSKRQRIWTMLGIGAGLIAAMWLRPPSDLGRVVTWTTALDAFAQKPWLGWGLGNFYMVAEVFRNPAWAEAFGGTTQDHAHNLFLEAAASTGFVGVLALCTLLRTLWNYSDRTARAALLGVFVVGMLNPLPVVVKALCLALAASSQTVIEETRRPKLILVNLFILISFAAVAQMVYWDRMMTNHGSYPWSLSSRAAAIDAGVLRYVYTRQHFKF